MQEFVRMERTSGKRASQTYIFFLSLFLQNCTIHNVDNVKSSHLIKLVHAVQSLKKKKNALMSRRESGQIIKYKLISVLNPSTEQWIAFRKLKKDMGQLLTLTVWVYNLLLESSKKKKKNHSIHSAALILYIRILE